MVNHVRRRLLDPELKPLRYLVLDFRHVSGVDSAAIACFLKIRALIEQHNATVFYTHVPPDVARALEKAGIELSSEGRVRIEHDIDHALERCEEHLLSETETADLEEDLEKTFADLVGPHERLGELIEIMTERRMEPGEVLIRAGEIADDVFFIGEGRVRVQITLDSGRVLRLRTMTHGAVVGEIAFYLGQERTADVVVETPSVIYGLTSEQLDALERDDPTLAILAHRILAGNLSEKLATATRVIRAAQH
jgi:SulP family sulfate permease